MVPEEPEGGGKVRVTSATSLETRFYWEKSNSNGPCCVPAALVSQFSGTGRLDAASFCSPPQQLCGNPIVNRRLQNRLHCSTPSGYDSRPTLSHALSSCMPRSAENGAATGGVLRHGALNVWAVKQKRCIGQIRNSKLDNSIPG